MNAGRIVTTGLLDPLARLGILTSIPPWIWAYRLGAESVIRMAVYYLTAGVEIRSIYLIRGFARREEVYGISDIDLLVVVEQEHAVHCVVRRYQRLATLVPLFDPVHGVVSYARMKEMYRQHDICKYRYNLDAGHWRLLYGEEIRPRFTEPLTGLSRLRSLEAELCKQWNSVLNNLVFQTLPRYRARYRLHKFFVELQRILSRDGGSHDPPAPASPSEAAASLRVEARRCLLRDPPHLRRLQGWMHRVNSWHEQQYCRYFRSGTADQVPIRITHRPVDLPGEGQLLMHVRRLRQRLEEAGDANPELIVVPRLLSPTLASLLNPRVDTPAGRASLRHLGVDDCCIFYAPGIPLDLAELRQLAAVTWPHSYQRVDLFLALSHSCFCLTSRGAFYDARPSVLGPLSSPVTFQLLSKHLDDGREVRCAVPVSERLRNQCQRDLELARELLTESRDEPGMLAWTRLWFHICQCWFTLQGLRRGTLDPPLTSRAITRRLTVLYPEVAGWAGKLQRLHEQRLSLAIDQTVEPAVEPAAEPAVGPAVGPADLAVLDAARVLGRRLCEELDR